MRSAVGIPCLQAGEDVNQKVIEIDTKNHPEWLKPSD